MILLIVVGHDLTRAIFEPLSSQLSLSFADNKGPRRELWNVKQYEPKDPYFQANINIQGGADLHYTWNEHHPTKYKVIHFVRDPFDYIVSAYLYHAQQPPPPEKFVGKGDIIHLHILKQSWIYLYRSWSFLDRTATFSVIN